MLTLIVFILLLSILVIVHELGHYLAAKIIGVKVEEFGLGYPPKLFGKKIGETEYTLNALPFGGFVRLYGENGETTDEIKSKKHKIKKIVDNRAFCARSKLERMGILTAGVAMNFVLGVVVITYLFTQGVVVPTEKVRIQEVLPNTPANFSGLKVDDVIVSINGVKIKTAEGLIAETKKNAGKSVSLFIQRCGQKQVEKKEEKCENLTVSLVPREVYPKNEGPMGVAISNLEIKTYKLWEAPFYGTIEAFKMTGFIAKGIMDVVWQLVSKATVPKEVAGPIGIYQVTGQVVALGGLMGILQLLGLLSLNLAVVNMLPIPALDGGRFFLIILEIFLGRKKINRIEKVSQGIGDRKSVV